MLKRLGLVNNWGLTGLGFLSCVCAGILLLGVLIWQFDKHSCKVSANNLGKDYRYDFWVFDGCFIEVNGVYVKEENIRITDDGRILPE